jgi:hypothetical protein
MRYFLTPTPDGIVISARAESPELDVIGDLRIDLTPGESLDGIPFADISAAAYRDGFIDIPELPV